ncbi:hypothetical protein [Variovorax sp. 350MFTsu5.1]|uniref:hypothetical protein n=1 Tax=Variovorax sp. 350MFTsu5.1 TaxID=3158365 RepID=UPI003AAD0101
MPRPILYLYIGAQRLQAAWSLRRGAELRMLSDAAYEQPVTGDASPPPVPIDAWPEAVSQAMEALGRVCQAEPALRRGAELRVLVSDQWVPSTPVAWNAAQYRPDTGVVAARSELREAGYEVLAGDLLLLDDAPLRQPRLAVCYPAALLEHLDRLAAALKTRPSSITTLSALAWRGNDAPGQTPTHSERLLAILEPIVREPGEALIRQVILVRGQWTSACIDEVLIRPLHAALQADGTGPPTTRGLAMSIAAIVQRLGWHAVPSPTSPEASTLFSVIDLAPNDPLSGVSGPIAWWVMPQGRRDLVRVHALDAVARAAGPSLVKLLALACVLGGIGLSGMALWRNEARLQEALDAASAARRAAVVLEAPPPSGEQAKRIAAVNAVVSELNIPLPRLLRALQPPRDIRVGLLGLELVAGRERGAEAAAASDTRVSRPTLKVHAEAPTSTDMTRYVAFLSDRKPLNHAYLVKHEMPDSAASQSGGPRATYRFTVEVTWKD